MLKPEDLDGLKLVDPENLATEGQVRAALENAYVQGSQGWGVRGDVAVILQLARNLRCALHLAAETESMSIKLAEAQNKLKGVQLELGRVKKQRDALEEKVAVTL